MNSAGPLHGKDCAAPAPVLVIGFMIGKASDIERVGEVPEGGLWIPVGI